MKYKDSFVYLWRNNINGKFYVGSHIGTLNDGYTGSGKYFNNAVKKYGIENFTRTIMLYLKGEDRQTILDYEAELIQILMNNSKMCLYNLCVRGTGKYKKGYKLPIHIAEKIRLGHIGVKQKKSTIEARVKSNFQMYGGKHKKWYCTPTGCFISSLEAAKYDDYSYRAILDFCKNSQHGYSIRSLNGKNKS